MQFLFFLLLLVLLFVPYNTSKTKKKVTVDDIVDIKDFKKLLRTKTNVLVLFSSSLKESAGVIRVFREVAESMKGEATFVLVDCTGDAKKMCKKLKVAPEHTLIKHYKDGDFHRDFDRKQTYNSMLYFMRDPTGDIPWEDDEKASDVMHIGDIMTLTKFIKKESKPLMVMFYAPWCGYCKTLKPEYAAAAKELRGHSILAAIDVNRPENANARHQYNITGFPTMLYFHNGELKIRYEGDNNKKALVDFMHNPQEKPAKVKEPEWSEGNTKIVYLTSVNFDTVLKDEASVLVMFYAPWCGHCKKMKPEYEKAASFIKKEGISGVLAALDATKEPALASRFSVKGYPTVKYFSLGEFKFDVNVRESNKIIEFMRNPTEPPPPPPPEKPWSEEESEVVHLVEETYKPFLKKKKHVMVVFYAPWCGHCKRIKPEFVQAAEHFKDDPKVEFAAVDCTSQQALCSFNNVHGYPTLKYFNYNKNSVPYNGGRTYQELITFMVENEKPSSSSSESSGSLVTDLTDSTFKDFISSSKPALILFHAPWCAHCKTMKPDFIEAAKELSAENFPVKVGMLDVSTNPDTTDEYEITGLPILKLFYKGNFVDNFMDERTKENFVAFVKKFNKRKDEL